jgi:pimeloyl-ACP methyl ester carboxylesterase
MRGIGLELARRGFVALCLDLLGHGGTGGTVAEGTGEPSFGVLSAVQYLRSHSFVNASAIGLVGHSLGGGAVRAAFVADGEIGASVLVAGGLGDIAEGPEYGVLDSSSPKNLLVIVGQYDVLFNLTQLKAEELPSAFGTQEPVVSGVVYGSFLSQTARKLATPATTHLFEPVDSSVVSEIVAWMENSFKSDEVSVAQTGTNQLYIWREATNLVSLAAFFGVVFLAFFFLAHVARLESGNEIVRKEQTAMRSCKVFGILGVLGLLLFFPMFFVGFVILFPPLIFGASIAWWMLSVGLIGLLVLVWFLPRFSEVKIGFKAVLVETFSGNHVFIATVLLLLMFAVVNLLQGVINVNLRIVSPLFRSLTSVRRILAFFEFLPFFLVYFLVEGLYFYELRGWAWQKQGFVSGLLDCGKVVLGKVVPFVAVICMQYVPIVLFNLWVLPSFVGFLVEFLWLIAPIFIITTICYWWFYRNTKSVWLGALFNALMMAWVASTTFPF